MNIGSMIAFLNCLTVLPSSFGFSIVDAKRILWKCWFSLASLACSLLVLVIAFDDLSVIAVVRSWSRVVSKFW